MAIARKNAGPIERTVENVSMAGCANSMRETLQLKLGAEFV